MKHNMGTVELFTYDWPSYMCRTAVALDRETGQAFDQLFVPTYGCYSEQLEQEKPISYDEVRKLARLAQKEGIEKHAILIVDPFAYDTLSEDTWRHFVENPPQRVWNVPTEQKM